MLPDRYRSEMAAPGADGAVDAASLEEVKPKFPVRLGHLVRHALVPVPQLVLQAGKP